MTDKIPYSTWDLEVAESQGAIDQMNAEKEAEEQYYSDMAMHEADIQAEMEEQAETEMAIAEEREYYEE